MGKFLIILLLGCAVAVGGWMYYLQVYAFYEEVPETGEDVRLTALGSGAPEVLAYDRFQGIDSESSPIRYRACFTTDVNHAKLSETYVIVDNAVPLVAPGWFDCFDAEEVGGALENGAALAFMGEENVQYGIDRIVAVHEDGRGWVWHEINRCGEVVFDGHFAPEGCPQPPQGY